MSARKNFANKIWNAYRLIDGWEVDQKCAANTNNAEVLDWYENKFYGTLASIEDHFEKYRISDALMATYKLVWDDFCSWLLEAIKPAYGAPIDAASLERIKTLFELNLRLLHPFMPFLTEELWQQMEARTQEEALIVSAWPTPKEVDQNGLDAFELATKVVSGVRNFRKDRNISYKETFKLYIVAEASQISYHALIQKMGGVEEIIWVNETPSASGAAFRVDTFECFIPLEGAVDTQAEKAKLEEELKYAKGFLQSVRKKLDNERFVSNAPQKVLEMERKKEADAMEKISVIEKSLATL